MKRITVPEVAAAYKKLGILPLCRGYSIVEERSKIVCACPQTALYYADEEIFPHGIPKGTISEALVAEDVRGWARWKYGPLYASWFRMFYDIPHRLDEPTRDDECAGAGDGLVMRFGLCRAMDDLGYRRPIYVAPAI